MNPYYYQPGMPIQHLPQQTEPKIYPCVVDSPEQLSTIPPMPNTVYLGLSRDGGSIFQRRMNNDGLMQMLLNMFMQGQFRNHPLMATVNQMMAGKTPEQQRQTIINVARSRGFDLNQLPPELLRSAGLTQQ